MLDTLERFRDDELPVDPQSTKDLRAFYPRWATEMRR